MPIPISELTPSDYDILKFANRYSSVSKEQIISHFQGKIESIEYRLEGLSKPTLIPTHSSFVANYQSCYLIEEFEERLIDSGNPCIGTYRKSKNAYHISPLGKKALQDYLLKKKADTRTLWLKNAWIPILVAFVTTVATNYILPKLPYIIEWFSHTLSKIFS